MEPDSIVQSRFKALFRSLFEESISGISNRPSAYQIYTESFNLPQNQIDELFKPSEEPDLYVAGNKYVDAFEARDRFLESIDEFKNPENNPHQQFEAKAKALKEFNLAMETFYKYGVNQIDIFFDENRSYGDRMLAYRRWSRMQETMLDMYEKLPQLGIDKPKEIIKDIELANTIVRDLAIDAITRSSSAVAFHKEIRTEVAAEVILHSIKRINPTSEDTGSSLLMRGGTIILSELKKDEANNRTYNCTRVVPATIATMFGSKVKALGALDDKLRDEAIRVNWKNAYESTYSGTFRNVRDLGELFNALEKSSPGTVGVMFNGWRGEKFTHVSVAANIEGVPCIVEGQSASVITRNPRTNEFIKHKYNPKTKKIEESKVDPASFEDIRFLEVSRAKDITEHDRAVSVSESLHSNFFDQQRWQQSSPKASSHAQGKIVIPPQPLGR